MTRIILMRHGKPLLPRMGWIAPADIAHWIEHYNRSEVTTEDMPNVSVDLATSAACVVASTAPRALSSVAALGHTPSVTDAMFCEAALPHAPWRFPRLPPAVGAAFFRLLWFFGYSHGSDSFRATQARAKAAAEKLVDLAKSGSVLLVGHGIMNRLIAKELLTLGWLGPRKHENRYWSASIYGFQL